MESDQLRVCLGSPRGNDMLKLLGSRGTMDILCVFCCSRKVARFTQLSDLLGHMSTKTLASRLKKMEGSGILNRTVYNEIPPRVEYSMTEKGQKLTEALMPLIEWVTQWADSNSEMTNCETGCSLIRASG